MYLKSNIYTIPDAAQVYLVGDLHVNYKVFKEKFLEGNYENCYFIFLGDQGILKEEDWRQYRKLDNLFGRTGNKGLFIRGNHDSPWLHNNEYYKEHFENFLPLNMGILRYRGKWGFILGGAISLNRALMEEGKNFWAGCDFIDPWYEWKNYDADFIIGHTAPHNSNNILLNPKCERFLADDPDLVSDLEREQDELQDIMYYMEPEWWFAGHYHVDADYEIEYDKGKFCKIHIVNINNIYDFSQHFPMLNIIE